MAQITDPKQPLGGTDSKVESVVGHCLYMIATAKWAEGDRLPSVREAEAEWSVNRLTVLKAYRKLSEMGLALRKDRSGYYVHEREPTNRFTRHRYELERLYARVVGLIGEATDLMPLAVLRYMMFMAEIEAREAPECAFVECTSIQAEGHAREIADRLGVPVIALTTVEIAGRPSRLPLSVRTILTSAFHMEEIRPLESRPSLRVHMVPIEVSPELVAELSTSPDDVMLLATQDVHVHEIARDANDLLGAVDLKVVVVAELEPALEQALEADRRRVVLTPRDYGRIDSRLREHDRVRPISFRITEAAWPAMADALGMPLGYTP